MTKMAISDDHVESRSCAVMLGEKEITLGENVHLLNSNFGGGGGAERTSSVKLMSIYRQTTGFKIIQFHLIAVAFKSGYI